jgi:hypothetical protein
MSNSKERDIMQYGYIALIYLMSIMVFLFFSCKNKELEIPTKTKVDTLIERSIKLNDSSVFILKLADKKTEMIVQNTINKVNTLEENNKALKNDLNKLKQVQTKTNTIIIRDTIYITEKKNFWGRKKVNVDSSGSSQSIIQDSTLKNE